MEPYNVLQLLGQGTFGTVILCERKHNKQKVVIKKISFEFDGDQFEAAKNEVCILKTLDHPNVIQYYDSYSRNNVYYIVMEYANRGTLHEFIRQRRGRQLSPNMVLDMFCQILMGLDHIHQKKIVHRDLKTENIFLSNCNVIKIGDFGISKILVTDKTSTSIGTTNYLAPEICDGHPYDTKSDIWSLGCVLYELCALERLFDGPMSNILLSIKSATKKCINLQRYGEEVQEIINVTVQVDPEKRPTALNLTAFPIVFPAMHALMVNLGMCQFQK